MAEAEAALVKMVFVMVAVNSSWTVLVGSDAAGDAMAEPSGEVNQAHPTEKRGDEMSAVWPSVEKAYM